MYSSLQTSIKDTSGFDGKDIKPKTINTTKVTTKSLIVKNDAVVDSISANSISASDFILNGRMNTTSRSVINIAGLINLNQVVYVLTIEQFVSELATASVTGGKSIIVAPGTFTVNSQISIPANTDIRGSGINSTIFKARSGFSDTSMFKIASNSSIVDFQLNGNAGTVNLLVVDGSSNVIINLMKFTNSNGNHFIIENSNNVDVTEVFFSDASYGPSSHVISLGYGAKNISFNGIVMKNIEMSCVHIEYYTKLNNSVDTISSISFSDFSLNNFSDSAFSIEPNSTGMISDINISNVKISTTIGTGVEGNLFTIYKSKNITLDNISIKDVVFGVNSRIFSLNTVDKITISGVSQENSDTISRLYNLYSVSNFFITDCSFESTVQNNTSILFGIYTCSDGTISRISSNLYGKVVAIIDSSNIKIIDSNMYSEDIEDKFTVDITTSSSDVKNIMIKGCRFKDASSYSESGAINIINDRDNVFEVENVSIEGNTIESNATSINIKGPIKKLYISNNSLYSTGALARGILLSSLYNDTDSDYIVESVTVVNNNIDFTNGGRGFSIVITENSGYISDYKLYNVNISNNSFLISGLGGYNIYINFSGPFVGKNININNNSIYTNDNSLVSGITMNAKNTSGVCISNNTIFLDNVGITAYSGLDINISNNTIVNSFTIPNNVGIYLNYVNSNTAMRYTTSVTGNIVRGFEYGIFLFDDGDCQKHFLIKNNSFEDTEYNNFLNIFAGNLTLYKNITIFDNSLSEEITSATHAVFYTSHLLCDTSSNSITVTLKDILPKSKGQKCKIELIEATGSVTINNESGTTIAQITTLDEFIIFQWNGFKWGFDLDLTQSSVADDNGGVSGVMDWSFSRQGSQVILNYRFDSFNSPSVAIANFTVPVGFRPSSNAFFRNAANSNSNSEFIHIYILTNGDFRLAKVNYSSALVNFSTNEQVDGYISYSTF